MLRKLKEMAEQVQNAGNALRFDPAKFNDPIATQTQWESLKGGSSSFRTHKLKEQGVNGMAFAPTAGGRLFSLIFIVIGLAIPVIFYLTLEPGDPEALNTFLFTSLFGLLFFGAGCFTMYKFSVPIVFDKTRGIYWKGRKNPEENTNDIRANRLRDVHAIQLLSSYVRSDKKSYYVYETNFILKDAERVNLVRQGGSRAKAKEDAKTLADFLGKPLWDAS